MTNSSELRSGHQSASSPEEEDGSEITLPVSTNLETYYQKHEALRGLPAQAIRKAWFTMAHLMVMPGATILDMGCSPHMTYAMAVMNPQMTFIGVNSDKKLIKSAQKTYHAENLEFRNGDFTTTAGFEPESVDAIINSFNLHEIFSAEKYSERAVIKALENHFSLLKQEGLMFICDFSMPPPEEYVLLEMPDVESKSEALEDLSETDLLVWYAQHARPHGHTSCTGFFLEELPPRFPQTRLFRLPYKWAYEFIMRKDEREAWDAELAKEYTFFTPREYRKNLRSLGARVLYTAPQWEDHIIKERFEGRFRLCGDDGKALPTPPTSFIAVAQKMGEKKSLHLHERRPSHSMENNIRIRAMRNDANGEIFDVISRDLELTEILPYRVTEGGDLNIFVHEGLPRGIANAVPRVGKQLDGKRWSGHMIEAISVPTGTVHEVEEGEPKQVVLFARDYLGLKPAMGCNLEQGPLFYPAPDFIDERIGTRYLRVTEHEGMIEPKKITQDLEGFTTKGRFRELNAQNVLNAISAGFIPNVQLETQILALYDMLEMEPETWDECPLALEAGLPEKLIDSKAFLKDYSDSDKRFKEVKGSTGRLRTVKSLFIDEGWVEGGIEGLASRDIEFVVSDDETVNKAVILPLTKHSQSGEVMAGLVKEYLPVPQRHKGNGLSLSAPSVTLPKDVTSIDQAKQFIAEKFKIPIDKVARLGESYFCHLGITPTRIFPFAIATTGSSANPFGGPVSFAPLVDLVHIMFAIDDFKEDRFILSRYTKVNRLNADTEVIGSWTRSANQIYQHTQKVTPAVVNASDATGLVNTAPPESPIAAVVRNNSATAAVPAAPYITSPDFVDVQHDSGSGGATYSSYQKDGSSKNDNTKSGKYKTK